MKKYLFSAFALCASIGAFAQTTNYSLKNDGTGCVNTFPITELNNASEVTLQLWVNPSEWVNGAVLLGQDNISLELGTDQVLKIKSGSELITVSCNVPLNQWTQITLTLNNGLPGLYINGVKQTVTGSLAQSLPIVTHDAFIIGNGFKGQLD